MFKPFGIFLLSLFMFTQVHNTVVWVNYEMNIEEITDLFCVNTDKPELNCHGTCHLKKQIISNENNSPVESNHQLYITQIQLFANTLTHQSFDLLVEQVLHHSLETNQYSFLSEKALFHPPQA